MTPLEKRDHLKLKVADAERRLSEPERELESALARIDSEIEALEKQREDLEQSDLARRVTALEREVSGLSRSLKKAEAELVLDDAWEQPIHARLLVDYWPNASSRIAANQLVYLPRRMVEPLINEGKATLI